MGIFFSLSGRSFLDGLGLRYVGFFLILVLILSVFFFFFSCLEFLTYYLNNSLSIKAIGFIPSSKP